MTAKIEIVNMALGYLGVENISDIDENTAQARRARLFYDVTRDSLLRGFAWTFALKQWSCPAVKNAPAFKTYAFGCQKPVDCLRFLHTADPSIECELAGKYIYSNINPTDIIGVRRIENESELDSVFIEVFALKLAVQMSIVLSDDKGLRDRLINDYESLIKTAQVKSALEGPQQNYQYDGSWLKARLF